MDFPYRGEFVLEFCVSVNGSGKVAQPGDWTWSIGVDGKTRFSGVFRTARNSQDPEGFSRERQAHRDLTHSVLDDDETVSWKLGENPLLLLYRYTGVEEDRPRPDGEPGFALWFTDRGPKSN